jgi:dimethylglycine dehydrogenase
MIQDGAAFQIEILGDLRPATLIAEPLFDPKGERMRG